MRWIHRRSSAPSQACDEEDLHAMLWGQLDSAREKQLTMHLESCCQCQRTITNLAAPASTWSEAITALEPSDAKTTGVFGKDDDFEIAGENLPIEQELLAWGVIERSDSADLVGTLGRYDLRQVLGFGGTGVVFKALDRELGRVVAVKILAPALSVNGAARRRFAREAQAAAAVVHDNVVAVHHVDASGKCPYLVMQYIDGESLQETVLREGPVDVATALRLTMQVADALDSSHAQGLIHRDIKPANLMIGRSGQRLWVTDFGLARAVDDASLTRTGFIAGTPHYMSPEQARGEVVGPSSDLFSLGGTLFFMLTGRAPFRADRTLAILNRICNENHRPVRDINGDVPEVLAKLVDCLLSKSPTDRPLTAATVRDECRSMLELHAAGKLPMSTKRSFRGVTQDVTRKRFAVGSLLVLATFACGMGWKKWSKPQRQPAAKYVRAPDRSGFSVDPMLSDYSIGTGYSMGTTRPQSAFVSADRPMPSETDEETRWAIAVDALETEIRSLERPVISTYQVLPTTPVDPSASAIDRFEDDLRELEKS